jgi:hypothetical protein
VAPIGIYSGDCTIPEGAFLGVYAGEVITSAKAERLGKYVQSSIAGCVVGSSLIIQQGKV